MSKMFDNKKILITGGTGSLGKALTKKLLESNVDTIRIFSRDEKKQDDNRVYINSLGEGAIWIVNTNGNLENGDYIQSSDVIGYGEKQTSEFLANYTVAKITCNCNFDINSTKYKCESFVDAISGNTYLKAFVGCTYHCG